MRIMTSNIWGDYFNNPVEDREKLLFDVFDRYKPDILGLQEVNKSWYESNLLEYLSEEYCFVGTEIYENTNYVPMAYEKGLLLLAKGYERLLDTTDKSKAITWAVFQDAAENKFGVCNTHFWWKTGPEHDLIRVKNAKQLTSLIKNIHAKYECPVFAFGDMNTTISSEVFQVYAENDIQNLYDLAEAKDNISSHHGDPEPDALGKLRGAKTGKDRSFSIDHMVGLGSGFKVLEYRVVTDQDALDATDHSPVYVDIIL